MSQTDTGALTVSQLNESIRVLLEGDPTLRDVWVQGEISGAKLYSSGHLYFSLKDADSVISGVMFKWQLQKLTFRPENGMKVILHGRVSAYVPRGQYQLIAEGMAPDGAGALAVAFEQLKARLGAEGLFDPARKKPLPFYPRRIGVITSPSGAAIHDIIRVTGHRCPSVELLLFPSPVQGAEAPRYLASGVRYFNAMRGDPTQGVDVIILGRGGGSAEDLWCFNDENLARTIAASDLPIISAVGHEVDFSISDFVADCRAATPSAAAELAVPDREDLSRRLDSLDTRMHTAVLSLLNREENRVRRLSASGVLTSPEGVLTRRTEQMEVQSRRLTLAMDRRMEAGGRELSRLCGQLDALSPLGVLKRGYALVQTGAGHVVSSVSQLKAGESVSLRLADGQAQARILEETDDR
jgi:exodeoxyribonuclease VII large subunit